MDPIRNPYTPGAGLRPPLLAGREGVREAAQQAIERARIGQPGRGLLIVGLRGVGKTALLEQLRLDAEAAGIQTLQAEAVEGRSLPSLLAPQLRVVLLRLARIEHAQRLARRGLQALAGFAQALKRQYRDIDLALDAAPEPGLADSGQLDVDLAALLEQVGLAARAAHTAVAMFVDELQQVDDAAFGALVLALHRMTQLRLPVALVGGGLTPLRSRAAPSRSTADRLFDCHELGPLPPAIAALALVKPAAAHRVRWEPDAVAHVLEQTGGFPTFLQEWGRQAWAAARHPPITLGDAEAATVAALAALDAGFFRWRYDRLTLVEKRYLRAMAELGPGPHRSGDIAERLGRKVTSIAPTRNQLIAKGVVWSPLHGETAFSVPLYDAFLRRMMPGDDWAQDAG